MGTIHETHSKIIKEIKAPKDLKNNFGNYSYRNVESIYEAVKPLLEKNKLSLTLSDTLELVGNRIYIKATATLTNEKGESVSVSAYAREQESKKGMDEAQITGSASSYARKYALGGLFLLDDNKDIDSQDNTQEGTTKPKQDNVKIIINELTKLGLSMADIKNFMEASNYKSTDKEVMAYLVANLDKLKAEAEAFMQNAVNNGLRG
ncbi:MAG TPA: single-stranded DNA-binding protein [Helicobacter sp.]|nr:single-stranded DNA-binding protein [Helicobacter sp.]